jgi:hypothetical protein
MEDLFYDTRESMSEDKSVLDVYANYDWGSTEEDRLIFEFANALLWS